MLLTSIDTGLFACITPTKVLLVSSDWVNVALIIFSPPVNWPPDVLVICEILKGTKPPAICDKPRLDAKIGAFEEAFWAFCCPKTAVFYLTNWRLLLPSWSSERLFDSSFS